MDILNNKGQDKKNYSLDLPVVASGSKSKSMGSQTRTFWKSLNIFNNENAPEILKAKRNEFEDGVTDDFDINKLSEPSRRKFLALLSAGAAFATTACTNYRDKGKIISYNIKPEQSIAGIANYYASTYLDNGRGWGILVKAREGRPIKLDGNPEHPINQGKIDLRAQASILDLYDPSRLQNPLRKKSSSQETDTWESIEAEIGAALKSASASGKSIVILTHSQSSPSFANLLSEFKAKYPTTQVMSYELFNDSNKRQAWNMAFGTMAMPLVNLDKAKIILSFDSNFLGTEGDFVVNSRDFAKNRDANNLDSFSRFYAIESRYSMTGGNADYRLRLTTELHYDLAMSLASEIVHKGASKISITSELQSKLSSFNLSKFAGANGLEAKILGHLVEDLIANRGKSIVIGGNHHSVNTHLAVNLLNEILGNSEIYSKENSEVGYTPLMNSQDRANLVNSMNSGKVGVFINLNTNPSYHFPSDLGFDKALANVGTSVSLNEFENETSKLCNFVLPIHHNMESWGDAKVRTGIVSLAQPIISPLYNTRQKEAVLLSWMGTPFAEDIYYNYIVNHWHTNIYPQVNTMTDFQSFWNATLHDGVLVYKEAANTNWNYNQSAVASSKNSTSKSGFTLVLTESISMGDGRQANNGWLQELPNPISKVTWDNHASLSPKTAKDLGVDLHDEVEVSIGNRKINLAVVVQPGLEDNLVSIDLGYGRTAVGPIGQEVGANANSLMGNDGITDWVYTGASVKKLGSKYKLASVQEHHALDDSSINSAKDMHKSRHIIEEASVAEYKKNPNIIKEGVEERRKEVHSITQNHEYKGVKWAMAIDMNKCTGCNECTIACNVENNIPVVGKDQVLNGREMSWIRIDRYFSGTPNDPSTYMQPMLCQHCDNAPCENVCPVVATTHSPDGLNQMVYNRCVGTRYCANNCPYKVRRFNYYDFRDRVKDGFYYKESVNMVHNPEVTVRSRGVIEKCTFCIQRISEGRSEATRKGEKFNGAGISSACQDACPTSAIVFGNSNDPESNVSKMREHNLGYYVLEMINVRPNVTYISKLRNVHEPIMENSSKENGGA